MVRYLYWSTSTTAVHKLSHPGRKPTVRLVSQKFVWPGLKKDVRAWVDSCVACQCAKVHRHTRAPFEPFTVPERRFDHVNIDLVGPLPPSHGFTYLLTMVDMTTRWPEAVPLSSTTASDVARAFIATWVARFGTPSVRPLLRSRTAVHLGTLECGRGGFGGYAAPNYRLSPTGERVD